MAVATQISYPAGAGFRIVEAKPSFELGSQALGNYGAIFVYGKASAALAAGDVVYFDKDFNAAGITTSASPLGALIGVPRVDIASGSYGWFQVKGQAPVRTANAATVNTRLNTTATAGAVDDDGTTGAKVIDGMVLAVAAAGASTQTEATLRNPVVGATL